MSLDRIDTEILRLLQNDARLSNKQIAAAVGLAPSSVHDRIKRLWADGVMIGLHAEIAPQAMGVGLEALLMIELAKHERATVDRFMDDIVEIPEVRSAHLITGRYDLVVRSIKTNTHYAIPMSNLFHRNTTGSWFISSMPLRMRAFSSSSEATRIWRRNVRAIFENAHSMRFSQEPCLGV